MRIRRAAGLPQDADSVLERQRPLPQQGRERARGVLRDHRDAVREGHDPERLQDKGVPAGLQDPRLLRPMLPRLFFVLLLLIFF